jgi:hypothetical protein
MLKGCVAVALELPRRLPACRKKLFGPVHAKAEKERRQSATRRSSVKVATRILEKAGLITYTRGHVTIEDHVGLTRETSKSGLPMFGEKLGG